MIKHVRVWLDIDDRLIWRFFIKKKETLDLDLLVDLIKLELILGWGVDVDGVDLTWWHVYAWLASYLNF